MNRKWRTTPGLIVCLLLLFSVPHVAQRPPVRSRTPLRIYLARHGQTEWNLEGRTQGGTDIPLNATGRRQAERLKTLLSGVQFDAVYASALSRSRETAETVHGSIPITTLPGLGERRFGKFEGRLTSDSDVAAEFQQRIWTADDALDGGESLNLFRERVRAAFSTIQKQHPSGSVLVVGHSYTNRMLLSIIFGLTVEQMRSFEQANDELYLIELDSGSSPHLWKMITEANLKDL